MRVRERRWGAGAVAVAIVAASVLVLGACASPSTQAGTSSPTASETTSPPSATASPTASPVAETDPLESVTALIARPTALELRDSDGVVLHSLDYMSPAADAIAVLSVVFGAQPSSEPYRGTNHTPPGVMHSWADFVLDERNYDEEKRQNESLDYVWPRFAVYFDAAESGGVSLASADGQQAGDAWDSVSASPEYRPGLKTCVGTPIEVSEIPSPSGERVLTVVVIPTDDNSTVKSVSAPETMADGCA